MHGIWGVGQLMFTKYVIVVDHDVDVQNLKEVMWRVGANTDPARDLEQARGPMDHLEFATDHGTLRREAGHRRDAQACPREGFPREWPPEIKMDETIMKLVDERWSSYGI